LDRGNLVFAPFLGKTEVDTVAEAAADAFQPPAIPEPSTFLLFLIGILGTALDACKQTFPVNQSPPTPRLSSRPKDPSEHDAA
jgi:hypothetical protein